MLTLFVLYELAERAIEALRRRLAKLDALRGIGLTLVDASSLVWLEIRGIDTVWGTDRRLAIEGAQVVPGPA